MTEPITILDDFIKSNPDARELKRALAVKFIKLGKSYREIMELLNVSLGFISKWWHIYEAQGTVGLKLGYEGRASYLNPEDTKAVIEWIKQGETWTLEQLRTHLREEYEVVYKARRSYYDLFKRAGISWKKTQKGNPKKDPQQVEAKQAEISEKLAAWSSEIESGERIVFFQDECHLLWGDVCGYVWGPTNQRLVVPMTNEKERQTYYGVVNIETGGSLVQSYPKGNGENTVAFLKLMQQKHPGKKIVLLWDGASYHKYGLTRDYLGELNEGIAEEDWPITCILLAPHAPEQNPVEDIWLLGKQSIREKYNECHSFKDVKKFFVEAIQDRIFSFPKLDSYRRSHSL